MSDDRAIPRAIGLAFPNAWGDLSFMGNCFGVTRDFSLRLEMTGWRLAATRLVTYPGYSATVPS